MSELTNTVIKKFWKIIKEWNVPEAKIRNKIDAFLSQELESLEERVKKEVMDIVKDVLLDNLIPQDGSFEEPELTWIMGITLEMEGRLDQLSSHPLQEKEENPLQQFANGMNEAREDCQKDSGTDTNVGSKECQKDK